MTRRDANPNVIEALARGLDVIRGPSRSGIAPRFQPSARRRAEVLRDVRARA